MDDPLDPATIVGLLADEARLRVVAAIVLGASSTDAVVSASGLDRRRAVAALERLTARGLVERGPDGALRVATDHFVAAARQRSESANNTDPLRPFVREGRLVSFPAARARRQAVLDWLAGLFEPGRQYAEREVNRLLEERVAPDATGIDHVTLRRYLVDEEFLDRREGTYWRAGGTFEV